MRIRLFYGSFLIAIFMLLMPCCRDGDAGRQEKVSEKKARKSLLEVNKKLVKTEEQHIVDFLARYGWEMDETGSGLRYMIYMPGDGKAVEQGDIVELEYEVRLITGDMIYSSDSLGPMIFKAGKGEVISGLEEGILLLHVGDKAKFIIPSHLAFGLLGDDDQIPTKATLIYDVEVIQSYNTR